MRSRDMTKKITKLIVNGVEYRFKEAVPPTPTYRTFTVSWTETSNPAQFNPVYSDDATGLTAGSTEFDKFFGYSAVRLSSAGVETAEITQADSGWDGKLDVTRLWTLTSGDNVMIKFPRRWIKMSKTGSTVTLSITDNPNADGFQYYAHTKGNAAKDYLYLGAYKMVSGYKSLSWAAPLVNQTRATFRSGVKTAYDSTAGYDRYSQITLYPRWYINALYMMKYWNPDSQSVVWSGVCFGAWSSQTWGTNSQINATYWTNTWTQIKLFWLEDWWWNVNEFVDACLFGGNSTGNNAPLNVDTTNATLSDAKIYPTNLWNWTDGWISRVAWINDKMFMCIDSAGSASTYYTDYSSSAWNGTVIFVWWHWWAQNYGWVFLLRAISSSQTATAYWARLQYL